jgi:hypothetical protein
MPLTEDDPRFVEDLRGLLRRYDAGWIIDEVNVELANTENSQQVDPVQYEARLLVGGLAASIASLPAMLIDANEILTELDATGFALGGRTISFDGDRDRLRELDESAAVFLQLIPGWD